MKIHTNSEMYKNEDLVPEGPSCIFDKNKVLVSKWPFQHWAPVSYTNFYLQYV